MQHQDLIPARGAIRTLALEVERDLTAQDLLQLQTLPATSPPPLKTLSARHRRQAQLLARGLSPQVVAEALGTTTARVYQLKKDPAFNELIAIYEDQIHESTLEDEKRFQEKMRAIGEGSADILIDRLEGIKDDVPISNAELRQLLTMSADRTVAPPKTIDPRLNPPQNVTLNFGTTLKPPTQTIEHEESPPTLIEDRATEKVPPE